MLVTAGTASHVIGLSVLDFNIVQPNTLLSLVIRYPCLNMTLAD